MVTLFFTFFFTSPFLLYVFKAKQKVDYYRYLHSKKWQKKRKRILKRDGNKCSLCGSLGVLDVHHLSYENLGNEKDWQLITVCRSCHDKLHSIQHRLKLKKYENTRYLQAVN